MENEKLKKKELVKLLEEMIDSIEKLPPHGKQSFVTNYDMLSLLWLLSALFRADCKEES
jgi:hypothetical protein